MDSEFWQAKWRSNEIGFHQADIHPLLTRLWPAIGVRPGGRVLVPLCGKSRDLIWLCQQGYEVVGFELSELAVAALFAEHGLTPERAGWGEFQRYAVPGLTVYCGDFLAAVPATAPRCEGLYDRAALIALAPPQRQPYVDAVQRWCAPAARGLLITVEYPVGAITAPPFSLATDEVSALYAGRFALQERMRQRADVKGRAALEVAYELVRAAVA